MSYVECIKSELDLFQPRHIQTSITKSEEIGYKPLTSLENQSVIEFSIQGNADTYIDLSSINLCLKVQMTKSDGTKYKTTDINQPAPVNNVIHSLFRQVNIALNGKSINSSDGNYSYRAYIESLLNYGDDAYKTHMELACWSSDLKNLDNLSELEGATKRQALFNNSAIVELYGKIHADMLNQPLLLLNNVDLRVTLTLNKPEFYLITENNDDTSLIKILEATLYVKHCTINTDILIAHHKTLEYTNAKYHYKRCEIKSFTIPENGKSLNLNNIVLGQLPSSLIFFMVDNDAYTGTRKKNPFNFKHNKIESVSLYVNGVLTPNESIKTDFNSDQYSRAYASLFSATGILHTIQGNMISKDMFKNGYFMLAYDLTADMSGNSNCGSLTNNGNLRLEARFDAPIPTTISCLIFLEYDATLEIDKNRNIITDF